MSAEWEKGRDELVSLGLEEAGSKVGYLASVTCWPFPKNGAVRVK